MGEVKLTDPLRVIHGAPWKHRGNGVIVDHKGRVLGAFENEADAAAVVALVNALERNPR